MVVSNEDTSLYYEDLDDESVEEDNITSMHFGVTIVEDWMIRSYGHHLEKHLKILPPET